MAVHVIPVVPVQIRTGKQKSGRLPAAAYEPDLAQVPALAKDKRAPEDVRGLQLPHIQAPITSFLDLSGEIR